MFVYNYDSAHCLMEFRKMSFPIQFDFSLLAGIIIRPLFTTFCSCFFIIFLEKITFFMLGTCYCIGCLVNFFLGNNVFSQPLQFCSHLNCLPNFMNLAILNIILDIFQMHCLLVFAEIPFTIQMNFSLLAGILVHSLFNEITLHGNVYVCI